MTRTSLTDGTGGWFDIDKSDAFEEETRWDGNNHISCATGSQWVHQILYRTQSKRWVLHEWSQWQGSLPTYSEIDDAEAAEWLVRNGEDHPDVAELIALAEI